MSTDGREDEDARGRLDLGARCSYRFSMKTQRVTISLSPPVTLSAVKAASGGNVSAWANELFARALAEPRAPGAAKWTRWCREPGRKLTPTDIQRLCDAE